MADFTPSTALTTPASAPPARHSEVKQVAQNTYVTGFEDPTVRQFEFELYQGRLNTTDRLFLLRSNSIIKARRHYHEKTKFILCNSVYVRQGDHEVMTKEAECCKKLGNNNTTFAALVIKYITERNGAFVQPFAVPDLRLWRFGVDKYTQLQSINREFPLTNHDVTVTCTDEKFQKLTINGSKQSVYLDANFPADIKAQFEQWADISLAKIPRELGKVMSDADILIALGAAGASAPTMQATDQPITDFSSIIGGMK